ncbi:MAG: TIGR01459 family HAD-type hydrolase [Pseudomonadota bacterium]
MRQTQRQSIPILSSARDLLAAYDAIFCDVWGVVHNGRTAYVEACNLLRDFRASGGTVILVSNAPRRAATVASVLDEKSVPRSSWDAIMSSGEISVRHINEKAYKRVFHLGPDRDLDLFETINAQRTPLAEAEAIVATGLLNDAHETGEDYRERLAPSAEQGIPLVCANPDLIVDVGGVLLPCAGAIATVYEDLGGPVFWAGKPHAEAYCAAQKLAQELRGAPVIKDRIIAIGDAERTDIAGAFHYGIASVFIGQGIHRADVMPSGDDLDGPALEKLFSGHSHRPIAALPTLK